MIETIDILLVTLLIVVMLLLWYADYVDGHSPTISLCKDCEFDHHGFITKWCEVCAPVMCPACNARDEAGHDV